MTRRLSLALVATLLPAPAGAAGLPNADTVRQQVRAWRQAHETPVLRELAELLAIPNSARDPDALQRNARAIGVLLERRGFETQQLTDQAGPPAVFGTLQAPGATRTVILYAHYDGQPVDPARWTTPPWEPVLRDGPVESGGRLVPLAGPTRGEWRLYARGASDDKAPIAALLAALDALRAVGIPPSVHLKVLFEGEEESGSPHLGELLTRHADLLRADLLLLCDGPVHQSRRMQLYFGARGVTDVELTVFGPLRGLHSGHYGNWAPNPASLLAHLLAGVRDPDGRILIPGYYEDVRPPSPAERRALAAVPDPDVELRRELGLAATEAEDARLVERLMLPALNLRGLRSGQVGETAANAIPTDARASIDFRLVPDQTPERVRERFEAHLTRQGFFVVHQPPDLETRLSHARIVQLAWGTGYRSARTDLDLPVSRAVARVTEEAAGGPIVLLPTLGGSIPMHLFQDALGTPVIGLPIANHDNNQHAADENLRLQNLWDGIEVLAALLARLGDLAP